jgi:mannonate dehydratase
MAVHPDDPPLSPLCGLERIMDRVASFDRLLEISPSPANALTFCVGCFAEMGADITGLIERYRERIPYVHVRDIAGTAEDFIETWPDDGALDLAGFIATLLELDVDTYIRPDHSPRLATEAAGTLGYGFDGHLFTLGYMRGLMQGQGRDAV